MCCVFCLALFWFVGAGSAVSRLALNPWNAFTFHTWIIGMFLHAWLLTSLKFLIALLEYNCMCVYINVREGLFVFLWVQGQPIHKMSQKGWEVPLLVQSTCCYWRGPSFNSQHPHNCSQPYVMPVPGGSDALVLTSASSRHAYDVQTCGSKAFRYIK